MIGELHGIAPVVIGPMSKSAQSTACRYDLIRPGVRQTRIPHMPSILWDKVLEVPDSGDPDDLPQAQVALERLLDWLSYQSWR